jgi:hypothetical protein
MSIFDDIKEALQPSEERPVLDRIMVPERIVIPFLTRYSVIERIRGGDQVDTHEAQTSNQRLAWADFWGWLEKEIPATKGMECRLNLDKATRPEIEVLGPMPTLPEGSLQVEEGLAEIRVLISVLDETPTAMNRYALWKRLEILYPEIQQGEYQLGIMPTGLYLIPSSKEKEKEKGKDKCDCPVCRAKRSRPRRS